MRTMILALAVLALAFTGLTGPAHAECGYFIKSGADCQPDGTIKIQWMSAENASCQHHVYSIQRRCGTGAWVTIANPASNPYYDGPNWPAPCLTGWIYRIKMTCVCGLDVTFDYSPELGPVNCP